MSTPVVYIGSSARSGSTLLETLLGSIPGFCPVGELMFIWRRGLIRNDLCGCGARFRDCPFWTEVGEVGFGGWSQVDAYRAAQLHDTVDRHRNLARLSWPRQAGKLGPTLAEYAALTGRLYEAVSQVSGAPVIVDSSKHTSYALLLSGLSEVDLRLVHLVRRSEGVAYSWSRRVLKPGVGDGTSYMSRHGAAWSVGLWITDNLLYDAIGRRLSCAVRVRYEDLVAYAPAELSRVLREIGLPAADQALASLADGHAKPAVTHAFSGNPMRQRQGPVTLRADDDWRTAMSRPRRGAIGAATWPLLWHYGYLPKGRARS